MKKALIILLLIMIALSGCSGPFTPKENVTQTVSSNDQADSHFKYAKPLTLEQVKTAIILHGLQLTDNKQEDANDYAINNVTPAIFTIKPNNHILLIYVYESIELRKEVCSREGNVKYNLSQCLPKDKWVIQTYTAKNVWIVNMCNRKNLQPNPTSLLWKSLSAAADILNDVKEIVFTDKSTYWDARLIVKYYRNMYKDKDDYNRYDMYSQQKGLVKHLGSDPESIHHIEYKYKGGSCGCSCTNAPMQKIGNDYYFSIGGIGSNTSAYKDDVYTLTIQWDGKKETLHLKRSSE
ncbi:MAG: hypothetical protein U9N81_14480 [Bacillota bacterium]|nr:hypothetical protein [Bacillota bacterium]